MIAVDALAARYGGTAYAAVQIVRALALHPDVGSVVAVCRPNSIVANGIKGAASVRAIHVPAPERGELIQRGIWEFSRLGELLRCHEVTGMLSMSGMVPRAVSQPVVSLQANPTPYEDRAGFGQFLRRSAIERTARHARAVYVPSGHIANLVEGLPGVKVVPLGVDHAVFTPSAGPATDLLCVGDFYAHKHYDLVLAAYARLPTPRPRLRLIGDPKVAVDAYEAITRAARAIEGVTVEGQVDFTALREAYANARALIIASDRESFSMPVAEALACGVPAIARDYPTLRETAGPGAIYVAGSDPIPWTAAIGRMIDDDQLHRSLRSAGIEHAKRYSWNGFADQLISDLEGPG